MREIVITLKIIDGATNEKVNEIIFKGDAAARRLLQMSLNNTHITRVYTSDGRDGYCLASEPAGNFRYEYKIDGDF